MKRIFTFWRLFALALLALAIYALTQQNINAARESAPHLARYQIAGLITADPARDALLRGLAADDAVQGVILRIDSPGGTVAGSEALYEAIREISRVKPVVAQMEEVAASGGYIAAIAADHIVARGNTITGSIGVVKQEVDARGLMEMLGLEISERRSDVFKARPSPFSETPREVSDWEDEMIEDAYLWFRNLVGERRELGGESLDAVADGRAFSGRQALARGLVDAIGGPETARAWLADQGLGADLPIFDKEVEREDQGLLARVLGVELPQGGPEALALKRLTAGPRLYSILK